MTETEQALDENNKKTIRVYWEWQKDTTEIPTEEDIYDISVTINVMTEIIRIVKKQKKGGIVTMRLKFKFFIHTFIIISSIYLINTTTSRYLSEINSKSNVDDAIPQIELETNNPTNYNDVSRR